MSSSGKGWTQADDGWLRRRWVKSELTVADIANELQRTGRAIRERAALLGLPERRVIEGLKVDWTPERTELMRRLVVAGYSAAETAKEIGGGATRNAVIGKAHRMGLSRPVKPAKPVELKPVRVKARAKPSRSNPSVAANLAMKAQGESTGPKFKCEPVPETIIPPGANPKTLADLDTACECRWPMGSPPPVGEGELWLFCADARTEGSVYCVEHHRKSIAKSRTAAEKAADEARAKKMRDRAKANASANSRAHSFLFAKHVRAA